MGDNSVIDVFDREEKEIFEGRLWKGRSSDRNLTGFLAARGCEYSHDLMVVGRAGNGWARYEEDEGIFDPKEGNEGEYVLKDKGSIEEYARSVKRSVTQGTEYCSPGCPMSWVINRWNETEYKTRTSAFWRCIREVVGRLEIAPINDGPDSKWPSHLVWSNLYKIAPLSGGNSGGFLRRIQQEGCEKLLEWEVTTYKPKRILFLTGYAG